MFRKGEPVAFRLRCSPFCERSLDRSVEKLNVERLTLAREKEMLEGVGYTIFVVGFRDESC